MKISSQYVFDYQKRLYLPEQYATSLSGKKELSLPEIVGKGYGTFWRWKGRYRVCKGSRASKKSKTTALWYIVNLMKYPESNLLVVRKVFRTLKDSCFTELKWAIRRLGVEAFWEIKESPLEMTYTPTGQKIHFRGLDDPQKVTSITVEHGYLCWMWIEEAYEVGNENDFNMLDESIRGAIPPETRLFKQITLTFNPWNEHHWIKKRFFDNPDDETLAMTTNYLCNEWLDEADRKVFETMRLNNPRRYRVAGLGDWGIVDGLIFENWEEKAFDVDKIRGSPHIKSAFGLDFGYTNDPSALFCSLVDETAKTLWVFDEMYEYGMSNERIAEKVSGMGYRKERIRAEAAEPKSIDRLYELGLSRIQKARKGKDSINNGIDYLQDYHIIVHPRCVNFITEISNYTWDTDTKTGKRLNKPIDDFNHLMDAMRYAMEDFSRGTAFSFA
ncbi:MAG: PBSX family phage terminase large subunit [Lachnospiraceae bacterium]|nr:PBSX family phage terminase large subunit [Lachnospiraceae bacterium]